MNPVVIKSGISIYIFLIMGLTTQSLFAQEDILKDYAESRNTRKICFYPSTLRMMNISQDQAMYDLVEPVDKLLVYVLDSTSTAERNYQETLTAFRENGFEEYAYIQGGDYDIYILGEEQGTPEWVGILNVDNQAFAFYLTGFVNWQKLLSMQNTFQDNEILNLLNLTGNRGDRR